MPKYNVHAVPYPHGIMVIWEEVEGSKGYNVSLYVGDNIIRRIRLSGNDQLYYTFTKLAVLSDEYPLANGSKLSLHSTYSVQVEAVGGDLAEPIWTSEKVDCNPKEA